jgi:hypothetical protein
MSESSSAEEPKNEVMTIAKKDRGHVTILIGVRVQYLCCLLSHRRLALDDDDHPVVVYPKILPVIGATRIARPGDHR